MPEESNKPKVYMPEGEDRTLQVRCYHDASDEKPFFVVIDGITYRREDDQKGCLMVLQSQDVQARFLAAYGEEAFRQLREVEELCEELGNHERDQIQRRLNLHLPTHREIIGLAFEEEGPDAIDWARHSRCTLPPA